MGGSFIEQGTAGALIEGSAQRAVLWERRGFLGRLARIDPSQMIDELLAEIESEQRPHAA
jgi:hypothetical protein